MQPKTAAVALIAVFILGSLAGCAGSSRNAELVVNSNAVEVHSAASLASNATVQDNVPVNVEKPKSVGHIIGVVVDPAIRPLLGARVYLPALDLAHKTDREGSFAFTDLYPGSYFVEVSLAGYESADTLIQVDEEGIVRVKFVLNEVPPPTPYHTTEKFEGFADYTGAPVSVLGNTQAITCGKCDFPMLNPALARKLVFEALMDPYQYSGAIPGGGNSFHYDMQSGSCCSSFASGSGTNPWRLETRADSFPKGEFSLQLVPVGFPLPESSKTFTVYLTTWFNSDPPRDWSFIHGDP